MGGPLDLAQKRFATDSPLERTGCEPIVPHRVKPKLLSRNRQFESSSLQRGVGRTSDHDKAQVEVAFTRAGPMVRIRFPPPASPFQQ